MEKPTLPTELAELKGVFGPSDVVPLISDLLPSRVVDAIALGFARGGKNASGLVQNDGHVFPPVDVRGKKTFCRCCLVIRETAAGVKRCHGSDCAGVKMLGGASPSSEEEGLATPAESFTETVTCYYCHAWFLEMLAPVRLYFGKYGESECVTVAGLWGGQFCSKHGDEMEEILRQLSSETSAFRKDLAEAYDAEVPLDDAELREKEENLATTAEDVSRTVTELFQRRERLRADRMVGEFIDALSYILRNPLAGETLEDLFRTDVTEALKMFVNEYQLRCSLIYRIEQPSENGPIRARRVAGYPIPDSDIVRPKSSRFASQWDTPDPGRVGPIVIPGSDDQLVKKIVRAGGGISDTDPVTVMVFATERGGQYIWVTAEQEDKRWQIRERGLQPAFEHIFNDVVSRMVTCLDTVGLLRERENMVHELQEKTTAIARSDKQNRDQITRLIIRMAHLISLPMLQLKLSADSLLKQPSDQATRAHFDASLIEMGRASKVFRTFASLSQEGISEDVPTPESISVPDLIHEVVNSMRPLLRLDRRPIEVTMREENALRGRTVKARKDWVIEALENLVHNAIKYSLGGRQVEIEASCTQGGIEVLFSNYGCGILPEEHEKVFDMEYRSEMVRQSRVEGTGIGLWVARRLIGLENGVVEVVSSDHFDVVEGEFGATPRYKTVFRLWLPFART